MAGVNKTHLTETDKETIDGFDLNEYVLQERLTRKVGCSEFDLDKL